MEKQEDGVIEEGATSQGMLAALGAEKGKEIDSPLEPPLGTSPADPFQTSDVQNCKRLNLCCFKPLSLW